MTTQRSILMLSIGLAVVYVWLRGGFLGLAAVSPAEAPQLPTMQPGWEKATFAMGCFWSAESDFDKLDGVKFTTSGYTGGRVSNPSYEQVSRGATGHAEAIEVAFDPAVVTYDQVLDYFWHHVDPFVAHRQFCDVGHSIVPRSSSTPRRSAPRPRLRRSESRRASATRLSSPSAMRARSILRTNRIRTITSSIPRSIATTAGAAAVTRGSRRSGERSQLPTPKAPTNSQRPTPKGSAFSDAEV